MKPSRKHGVKLAGCSNESPKSKKWKKKEVKEEKTVLPYDWEQIGPSGFGC